MTKKMKLVKNAMLSVQRYPWEQGVCAQALYEAGDTVTAFTMAHDAVLRQTEDGRLAVTGHNIAITDPAANGEVVLHAYELTGDEKYKHAAEKMLKYLQNNALRTDEGIICHNEISFHEGFSPKQIWVDAIYMLPPFLAVMGELDEAVRQIEGCIGYLRDSKTGLLFHIYDTGTKSFVRKKLWSTGNGWALLGMARVIETAIAVGRPDVKDRLLPKAIEILDEMLKYQLPDGRFHDILDDKESFVEGAGAMMLAAFIYRGIAGSWLSDKYRANADLVRECMEDYVDEYGIIHAVCGCPHFLTEGTSAESMAAYIMMNAHYLKQVGKTIL